MWDGVGVGLLYEMSSSQCQVGNAPQFAFDAGLSGHMSIGSLFHSRRGADKSAHRLRNARPRGGGVCTCVWVGGGRQLVAVQFSLCVCSV